LVKNEAEEAMLTENRSYLEAWNEINKNYGQRKTFIHRGLV